MKEGLVSQENFEWALSELDIWSVRQARGRLSFVTCYSVLKCVVEGKNENFHQMTWAFCPRVPLKAHSGADAMSYIQ